VSTLVRPLSATANPFADLLDRNAAAGPDKPYLVTLEGRETSYREFRAAAHEWAARLLEWGVLPGDRVALLVDNRPEFVELWFACQLLGATVVPFNPHLPEDTHRHLLRVIAPRVCAVGVAEPAPAFEAALAAERVPALRLDEERIDRTGDGDDVEPVALDPRHTGQVIFTSGTTGRPKGGVQSVELIHALLGVAGRIGLTPDDRLLVAAPLFHGLGQAWFQYASGIGATVIVAPRFSARTFWRDCRASGATAMQHVGAVLSFLLKQPPGERDRDHRVRLSFGVGAPADLWEAFEARFGVSVVEYYGMTETGLIAFNSPAKVGSCGRRTGLLALRLVDDEGRDVAQGKPGEAWTRPLKPGGKMPVYYADEEATEASRTDGWFRTGDLLREDADGYLYFLGRKKESLRRRGENIVPEDVERCVAAVPTVSEVAAVAVPSPHGDDDIKLCVVLNGPAPKDLAPLAAEISAAVPPTMRPRYLSLHDALPYTATAKVRRGELRASDRPLWDIDTGVWRTAPEGYSVR
jgi:crotonobetaine/carnitine-CoA ligase